MAPKVAQRGAPKAAESVEALEVRFTQAADRLFEQALDLNVSQASTAALVSDALNLRHKLLGLYGVAPDPRWQPGALLYVPPGGVAPLAVAGPAGEISWVAKLYEAMSKTLKRSLAKGEVTFNTVAADESGKTYTSTASCSLWKAEYSSSKACIGKKQAEHSAAKAVLQAEYPAVYATLAGFGSAEPAKGAQGQKRKAPGDAEVAPLEGKNLLGHYMQMLLARSVTKEDIIYEVAEAGEGTFSATVQLPTYKGSPSFTGEGASRKDAEMSAAKAACAKLEAAAKPLAEEHKAKKAAKMRENLEKLKKSQEEKKAAAKAAAEAAKA